MKYGRHFTVATRHSILAAVKLKRLWKIRSFESKDIIEEFKLADLVWLILTYTKRMIHKKNCSKVSVILVLDGSISIIL